MGLDDFEKKLAQSKAKESRKKRDRSRSRHKHHRSSHHHRDDDRDERHRHKRSRHNRETSEERARRKRRERERDGDGEDRSRRNRKDRRSRSPSSDEEDRLTDKRRSLHNLVEEDSASDDEPTGKDYAPPDDDILDQQLEAAADADLQRDSWMQAPSSMDIDYVQRKKKEEKTHFVGASAENQHALKVHDAELEHHLKHLQEDDDMIEETPAQRDVSYTFGDSGSQWRMMKLKGVYRIAEEEGRTVEDVALQKYGDLRDFDDAREEEIEVDRRKMYGKDYVGKEKPSGELYAERRLKAGVHRPAPRPSHAEEDLPQGEVVPDPHPTTSTVKLSQTELNKLKAQMMKAKMKGAANAADLEAQYNAALAGGVNSSASNVVVLNAMDNRMLAGGREGEVVELTNKRGRERGLVVENEDMSIEDMVRQERRTKNQVGGEGMLLAEKIAKDSKFDNDLDYLDENAAKLATRAPKSSLNLRNTAISDYHRTNRILDSCPLCHHEDKSPPQPPVAPIVSLATRVFLTLPTEPEISTGGAVIVPIQHRTNLLECDDDEWEEIRNFMKCLTRMYHAQGRDVLFYENAANPGRKLHAAMNAVPIPFELGETAPAYFREAILTSDAEWSQHKPIIDTLKAAKTTHGKAAFRKSLAREMPYFHVWFELDGGMGHIVEDERRWPRSDLFAREVLGGMLDVEMEVVKRQGRWVKGDRRVEGWKKGWRKFDWTGVLGDG
ncbi:hypothetical protein K458DRAFT_485724 [Lentithecium fluviatile CBS 122367]|uniref:Cell cycle control protein cwf19 n=1 Tax=Lentithecium fluviatile CBS 122367 TaxID=1168545 RepID=A0A6G1J7D4_9PLEO|nr:hypothetical protein K458DRAFT_485724 [Lentithecium fluviatile CBS 122367]